MPKIINFAARPNLKYPLQYLIYGAIRDLETTLLGEFLDYNDSLMLTTLMFFGEFFAGLIVYLYQKKFAKKSIKKVTKINKLMNAIIKKAEMRIKIIDSKTKIIFIIFCCAFFDFIQFILSINTPKFINTSSSIGSRLGGFLIIFDALFYYFILKFPISKHQLFCLIIIGSCLLIIIITEFIFQEINIYLSYSNFIYILFISFIKQFYRGMLDSDEKYLFEYDNMDPFYVLLLEGVFGFLLSFIYDLFYNPLKKFKEFKRNKTSSEFVILNICLIIYIVLCSLMNLFRVNTTKIFTPMTTTSIVYIFNPIYFVIDFSLYKDFIIRSERNYAYFFVNLIIGIIISFLSLVYNEFIILFCCNLDKDTHSEISSRAMSEVNLIDYEDISHTFNRNTNNDEYLNYK